MVCARRWSSRRAALAALSALTALAACDDAADPVDAAATSDAAAQPADARGDAAEPRACEQDGPEPANPVAYGTRVLACALAAAGSPAPARVTTAADPAASRALADAGLSVGDAPESFVIAATPEGPLVVGRDPAGALYGALELAERLSRDGSDALPAAHGVARSPAVPIRAANLFLVQRAKGEASWWFLDEGFWREYLDLLARSRINVLDLHGMYNLDNTIFPNALLQFADSASFPQVGAPADERARNRAMLERVVALAAARAIRVGLMTYGTSTSVDGHAAGPNLAPAELERYTREAAEDLARRVRGLWRLGFRIGESGRDAAWFAKTFVAGVRAAGTGVGVYTRTWLTDKRDVLGLVEAAPGDRVVVEAKYNGEQLGPPYPIAGGMFAQPRWNQYSYANYLDPPAPYDFVFQVRAGGTHRVFRYASYDRTRRMVPTYALGGTRGFTLEPPHAYFPQRDGYHARAEDRFSPWTFRRDELTYLLFGRLAYDPDVPADVFADALRARVGTRALWAPLQAASEIVAWVQTAHTCGPDHRDYAPELEWGGPVAYWASPPDAQPPERSCGGRYHGPFDSFAFAGPFDTAADLVAGRKTARRTSLDVALALLAASARAKEATVTTIPTANAEATDVVRDCMALAELGGYAGHKLRAATALAVYASTGAADWLAAARRESAQAVDAWKALADRTAYLAPFEDNLRMRPLGLAPFHWRDEVPWVEGDAASIDAIVADVTAHPRTAPPTLPRAADVLAATASTPPPEVTLSFAPAGGAADAGAPDAGTETAAHRWTVRVRFAQPLPERSVVRVLRKPLDALADFAPFATVGSPVERAADVDAGLVAIEIETPTGAWRLPDPTGATPYVVLPDAP